MTYLQCIQAAIVVFSNLNGLAPDSGGMAEVGNLGARGVPLTILKSQITSDFAGSDNPDAAYDFLVPIKRLHCTCDNG